MVEQAKEFWRHANAVCFDVDSTLIIDEAIDVLAEHCGSKEKVLEWTRKAMGGSVPFKDALRARLEIMQLTLDQVEVIAERPPQDVLTPGIEELVRLLHSRGTVVYLVSGGFHRIIDPLADYLNIPLENVFANQILFDNKRQYVGFDEEQLTCQPDGKRKVMTLIKEKYKTVVMIGDGATDMMACPPADTFIGFGGNVVREKVKEGAPWFIYSINDLITELGK